MSPSVETPKHERRDKSARILARFKRFCARPRNRAGIATAVLLAIPLLIVQAVKAEHPAVVAADAIPALFVAFLLGRALKTEPSHARSDEVGMLAYMPLAIASFTFVLIPALYSNVSKQPPHSLDSFYTATSGILAALLIALMIESHRLFHVDPQLQALRSWWIGCVVFGIIAALTGLTPTTQPSRVRQHFRRHGLDSLALSLLVRW